MNQEKGTQTLPLPKMHVDDASRRNQDESTFEGRDSVELVNQAC